MKKWLIMILMIFILGGCYDYNELNELAIIVGIGIDYTDNEYVITYEVLSNNENKESANTKSYTVTKKHENLAQALDLTADALPKKAYFSHADLLILSENVAKEKMNTIIDYLLRNKNIRETLNVVITKNPEEFLKSTSKNLAVVSNSVNDAITADKTSGSYASKKEFINLVREILSFGQDAAVSVVDIGEDKVNFTALALFHDYQMVAKLPKEEAAMYNLLRNEINNVILTYPFGNETVTNSVYRSNIKIKVSAQKIKVTGSVEATILANDANIDIKNVENITEMEKTFGYLLDQKIKDFISDLQKAKADILYFGQKYYINSRNKDATLWQQADIDVDINFNISKKGIIFEVQNAN